MRPKELSQEDCAALLSASRYGRLGLSTGDRPYVVPMSFVFADGKVFLHSRSAGEKFEMARANPNVCLEVDSIDRDRWRSVIVRGRATLSTTTEAKRRMFEAFTSRNIGGHGGKAFTWEMLEKMEMCVWEIEVLEMTGREGIW